MRSFESMDILQLGKVAMQFGEINTDNMSLSPGNYNVMDVNSSDRLSADERLDRYNDEVLVYKLPAIVYTAIMMVLGLPGNMVVFYIYFSRWRQSTSRIFILFIAALDMVNCATTLPMEIYLMRYSVKLDNHILCKVTRFATYAMNSASAIVLVGIAIDRFIHICRPHSQPFSSKMSKYICIAAIVFAIASTWPSFFLYGTRVLDLGHIQGYSCLLQNKFDHTPYPLMYLGVIFLITMILFVVLVVFYCLIGAKIYTHRKSKQKKCTHLNNIKEEDEPSVDADSGSHYKLAKQSSETSPENENENKIGKAKETNVQLMTVVDGDTTKSMIVNGDVINPDMPTSEKFSETAQSTDKAKIPNKIAEEKNGEDKENTAVTDKNSNTREVLPRSSIRQKKETPKRMVSNTSTSSGNRSSFSSNRLTSSVRYLLVRGASTIRRTEKEKCTKCVPIRIGRSTLMLFMITLAYILSFVPFYVIVIVRQSQEMFVQTMSKGELMAYNLFLRSYLLSSAINPFIYSFCNAQFREYCRDLFLHVILRRPQSMAMSKLQRRF